MKVLQFVVIGAIAAATTLSHAQYEFNVSMGNDCREPEDRVKSYEFAPIWPVEFRFLAGWNGLRAKPVGAKVNSNVYRSSIAETIAVAEGEVEVISGLVGDVPRIRIRINERKFCENEVRIAVQFELPGRTPIEASAVVAPVRSELQVLPPAGRRAVIDEIAERYADELRHLFGEEQAWSRDALNLLDRDRKSSDSTQTKCSVCGLVADRELALAFSLLIESLPRSAFTDEPRALLASPGVQVHFAPPALTAGVKPSSAIYMNGIPIQLRSADEIRLSLLRAMGNRSTPSTRGRELDRLLDSLAVQAKGGGERFDYIELAFGSNRETYVAFRAIQIGVKPSLRIEAVSLRGRKLSVRND